MAIDIVALENGVWTYKATAWMDDEEIYGSGELTTMYWTVPLAEMGRNGWELVGTAPENALMPSWIQGWKRRPPAP